MTLDCILEIFLMCTDRCSLHLSTRNASLQQVETTTESHNQPRSKVVNPSPNRYTYNKSPPRAQRLLWRSRQTEWKSQGYRGFAVQLCPLEMSEATSMKYHQHELRKAPIDKLAWKGCGSSLLCGENI